MSFDKNKREAIIYSLLKEIATKENKFSTITFAKNNKVTVQTVYRYINTLVNEGQLTKEKNGRKNVFKLVDTGISLALKIADISEDIVWSRELKPFFTDLPQVAFKNLEYAFTEILNNAIDHSGGTVVHIQAKKNAYQASIRIADDGVGIFNKIAKAMNLEEKSFAILELAKGKFTTEPDSHTGEGVFFSSKVVDDFAIFSDNLIFFGPTSTDLPYINEMKSLRRSGTIVYLGIENGHKETVQDVFNRFTEYPESYGFTKTLVPVRLLEYGDEKPFVVSRSQAKRLMVRFERFENIILDFSGIEDIGQGFADELFRVFPTQHPNTTLTPINCNPQVESMINRITERNE